MAKPGELVPLYAFTQGDSIGILILATSTDTIAKVIDKVAHAIHVRISKQSNWVLMFRNEIISESLTVKAAGIQALDRIDIIMSTENVY